MAMVVNHNIPALSTYNVINSTSSALQKSINKLSTGLRINSAADDAAGLAISEKMRAQVRGLDQAVANSQDGISMIQTAEGALSETHSILQRMRELSVQAANDTLTQQDRGYIQEEVDQLREEITRIGNTTQFNKKKLLNGDAAVLWSSDNLETKAVINGGLRTIDQFGQKSSAEGNYKIEVKANAGAGEVQKTDLMKIKHDVDFGIEGTSDFDGAALEGESNVKGVGNREIQITVTNATGGSAATLKLTVAHDLSNDGLADAINAAVRKGAGAAVTTATTTSLGDTFTISGAGLTSTRLSASVEDGKLVLSNSAGGTITVETGTGAINNTGGEYTDNLQKLLGATDETALNAQHYEKTIDLSQVHLASAAAQNSATGSNNDITFTIDLNSSGTATTVMITAGTLSSGTTQEEYNNAVLNAVNAKLGDLGGLTASLNGNKLVLSSDAGKITIASGGQSVFMGVNVADIESSGVTKYTNVDDSAKAYSVNKTNVVDSSKASTNFGKEMVGSKFSINGEDIEIGKAGGAVDKAKTVAEGKGETYVPTVDDIVADIEEQIQANDNLKDKVSVSKDADGNVRIFSLGSDDLTLSGASTSTDTETKGTLNALFGDLTTSSDGTVTVTTDDDTKLISKIVVKSTEKSGKLEDVLPLDRDYSFAINDTEGNEIAAVSVSGPFESATALADAINKQIAKADDAGDFKATVLTDDKGNQSVAIYSTTRDFALADGKDVDGKTKFGYEALLGKATTNDAKKNAVDGINTIGEVASSKTLLRDLDKFWDSEGNFLLEDPQTLTLTQGDGKQATITLYEYDTLGSMAEKINNAIANNVADGGLGQAQYLADGEETTNFATFVDVASKDSSGNATNTSESVEGTMLIRSIVPGSKGSISFSGNEALINALSLNTVQAASETQYTVNIEDAHSGKTVVKDAKITGNTLVGALHPNVDVEFDAMTGIKASWNGEEKKFDFTTETGTTFLHLSDNTTVFQIGANEGEDMGINIGDMRSHALGLDEVNVTNRDRASRSITVIDNAIDKVSMQRSKLGAYQNRLEHTINNLTTASENLTAAESRIRDTDMAKEMMNFSKLQIMLQAGNSMLAQANQLPQNVLSLVR